MTTKFMKLLGATTALVAFATTSHAATVSTATSTQLLTSDTTGGITVTGTGSIAVPTSSAIVISSSTAGNNVISISTGGIVRAGGGDAVISSSLGVSTTINAAITINNSGTIATSGTTTKAIDLSNGTTTNGTTINNAGTISGTVTTGAGVDVLKNTGTINGAVNLGDGANVVTLNGGSVNVASGNALTFGTGADSLIISNSAVVSGSIDFGSGADKLYSYGTYTTGGAISGLEDLQVSGTTTLNHAVTGLATVEVGTGSKLNVNNNTTLTGAYTSTGTTEIAAGKSLSAASIVDGGKFILNVASATSIGGISNTTGLATLTNTSFTIAMASTSGYITSGTSFIIVDNAGTGLTSGSLTASSAGVYRYGLSMNAGDVQLTVGRVSTSSVVTGESNQAIANTLDKLGTGSTGNLVTVQSVIGQQSTAAGVQNVVESLAPNNVDGLGVASVGFSTQTGNLVTNRLASLRSSSALKGVATGDISAANHMWVEGFGSHVEQDDHKGARGYEANGGGATFGLDSDVLVDGFTTGAAFSYGHGTVDSNAAGGASTDIDTYAGTLYGSHVLSDGSFVNAQLGAGYNKYDSSRNIIGVGNASADFNGWQATAKAEAGKDFAVSGFTLTPLAGLQATYLNVEDYTETGAGAAGLHVDADSLTAFDASAGGQAAYAIPMENGGVLKPIVRAKYIYRMGDTNMETTSRFVGGGSSFTTNGVKGDRSSVNLGTGLLLSTAGGVDFSVNYDADIRSSLTGHTGQLKARWAF